MRFDERASGGVLYVCMYVSTVSASVTVDKQRHCHVMRIEIYFLFFIFTFAFLFFPFSASRSALFTYGDFVRERKKMDGLIGHSKFVCETEFGFTGGGPLLFF
ncbi:hypothetical protein GGR50DRAFT_661682 [Xylaria sp. CBS 124048]|nr:hypothetical protein GGR50DRAFT_661682 [Xylaria sp. CBS 124048]